LTTQSYDGDEAENGADLSILNFYAEAQSSQD